MRKLISLMSLALMLSMLSGSVFASKYEQCDVLKTGDYTRGLIGLCNAYWTAVDKGKGEQKALDRYVDKMREGDIYMPGLPDPDVVEPDLPEPPPVTCPCIDHVAAKNDYDWGTGACWQEGTKDAAVYVIDYVDDTSPLYFFTTWFETDSDGVSGSCSIIQSGDASLPTTYFDDPDLTLEEYEVCLTELLLRCAGG